MKAPLLIVAATIALAATLASCADTEEEVAPGTVATTSPAPTSADISPTPLPATTTGAPAPIGWEEYVDTELGFSFPHPLKLTMTTEYFQLHPEDKDGGIQRRTISFIRSDGVTAFGVGVEPNPQDLSLEEYLPSELWPSEPEAVVVGGEKGLLFPINEMGDKYPSVVVKHGDRIYTIGGNVHGVPGAEYPGGISEADFQRVLTGFRFGD